jgi:hypothetical protein
MVAKSISGIDFLIWISFGVQIPEYILEDGNLIPLFVPVYKEIHFCVVKHKKIDIACRYLLDNINLNTLVYTSKLFSYCLSVSCFLICPWESQSHRKRGKKLLLAVMTNKLHFTTNRKQIISKRLILDLLSIKLRLVKLTCICSRTTFQNEWMQ